MNGNNAPPGADSARHRPRRGDDVDRWLKAWRDLHAAHAWHVVDALLDDYRLHADTGTPLDAEAADHG